MKFELLFRDTAVSNTLLEQPDVDTERVEMALIWMAQGFGDLYRNEGCEWCGGGGMRDAT